MTTQPKSLSFMLTEKSLVIKVVLLCTKLNWENMYTCSETAKSEEVDMKKSPSLQCT